MLAALNPMTVKPQNNVCNLPTNITISYPIGDFSGVDSRSLTTCSFCNIVSFTVHLGLILREDLVNVFGELAVTGQRD